MLCAGFNLRDPKVYIDKDNSLAFEMDVKDLKKSFWEPDLSYFCDSEIFNQEIDPRKIRGDFLQYTKIKANMKYRNEQLTVAESLFNFGELIKSLLFQTDAKVYSAVTHYLANYQPMKRWCLDQHDNWDEERCSMQYILAHNPNGFDNLRGNLYPRPSPILA